MNGVLNFVEDGDLWNLRKGDGQPPAVEAFLAGGTGLAISQRRKSELLRHPQCHGWLGDAGQLHEVLARN